MTRADGGKRCAVEPALSPTCPTCSPAHPLTASALPRRQAFKFTLGQGAVIPGWEHSLESMQVGEMADLKCAPEFAYGQHGSPPSIPPNATLTRDTLSKPRHSLRPAGLPAGSPQAPRRLSAGSPQASFSARSRLRPPGASGSLGQSAAWAAVGSRPAIARLGAWRSRFLALEIGLRSSCSTFTRSRSGRSCSRTARACF